MRIIQDADKNEIQLTLGKVEPSTQQTWSQDGSQMQKLTTEKQNIFEKKLEVEKTHLAMVQEAAAWREGGGTSDAARAEEDEITFMVLDGWKNADGMPWRRKVSYVA